MNISIPGFSETSPTTFSIQVSHDHGTYSVKRRYSEFVDFVARIEQEIGEKTPVDLPGKKWLGTKSRDFLEDRRKGLERFLRGLIKHDDWRESLALMDFLALASHTKPQTTASRPESTDWLRLEAETRALIHHASPDLPSAELRRLSVLARTKVNMLEDALSSELHSLGDGEYRRRKDIVRSLSEAMRAISSQALNRAASPALSETSGIPGRFPSPGISAGRVLGGETSRTRALNNQGLLSLQKQDLKQQDQDLESLLSTVNSQKRLGIAIKEELDNQNQLLDELDDDTHLVNSHLNRAKRDTKKFL